MITGFLAVVVVFSLIIIVHEWGHMMAAKLCGVAVPDFAVGMGPSLFSRFWRGTRYHLCLIPIGGFVQIAGLVGDDPLNKTSGGEYQIPLEATDGGRLTRRWQDINGFQKAFILVAGVLMNFLLAFVVMALQGFAGFPETNVVVSAVDPARPGAEAGLQPGDMVLSLNGTKLTELNQFMEIVSRHPGQPLPLHLRRAGKELDVTVTPRVIPGYNEDKASVGVGLTLLSEMTTEVGMVSLNSPASELGIKRGDRITAVNGEPIKDGLELLVALPGFDPKTLEPLDAAGKPIPKGGGTPLTISLASKSGAREVTIPGDVSQISLGLMFTERLERVPPVEAVQRSLHDGWQMMGVLFGSLKLMFTRVGAQSISGPIGIFSMLGQSAQTGWHTLLMWVVLINVNIGIMNLLPLPALDGGRLLFVGLAGLGLRIPERREALVHAAGMLMLLTFLLLVSVRDVGGLWRGWTAH
jgi:regulator of sigma E protease